MKFSINLLRTKKCTADGFPLMARVGGMVNGKYTVADKMVGRAFEDQWDKTSQNVNLKHPDYDILSGMLLGYHLRARRMKYRKFSTPGEYLQEVLSKSYDEVTFFEAWDEVVADMEQMMESLARHGDKKGSDRMKGNLKVYRNVRVRFSRFGQNLGLTDLDAAVLMRFKNYQLGIGNSKHTVHNYLRTIRAVWKKAAMRYKVPISNPFQGVFTGLTVKSYAGKKKHIDREAIRLLETADLPVHYRKYVDLWLLQFYFAGADLIDVYYLYKLSIKKGRVYFERQKTGTGLPIDLAVHPKALAIIERYKKKGDEWLFPWEKDKNAYESFRAASGKALRQVQSLLSIEVLPTGGYLGAKVARHTFATLAKQLFIEEDLLRELMGHERDAVDNYYKDRYPAGVRDAALFRVIDGG